jgi:catechol 2,3-dioxygenase-like lactoylglutathione lyase family enzyme
MNAVIDRLLDRYDAGHITRRELLATLGAIAVGGSAEAAEPVIGTVTQLNHVTVFVKDVQKSMMPGMNLKAGAGFLGIYPAQDRTPGINHVCLGIEKFDAERVLAKLKSEGLDANIRLRGDTKELYFNDPDGIRVQLQDVRYIGGVGPLGDRQPK